MDIFTLNNGQQEAASAFLKFLLNPSETEFIISGPAGTGKTYLMSYITKEVMKQYAKACEVNDISQLYRTIHMTATTNKAAEVLGQAIGQPAQTIHSLFKLRVTNDFKTGKTELKRTNMSRIIENAIIFIDECSFIDAQLFQFIQDLTKNCKIVYVGDDKQLAPVMEKISKIYARELPVYYLTEQMRNSGQQALMNLSEQMRRTVQTLEFEPIKVFPGVIDHITDVDSLAQFITDNVDDFGNNAKILAYTNNQVITYNNFIRHVKNKTDKIEPYDRLVSNTAMDLSGGGRLSIEQELSVITVKDDTHIVNAGGYDIECYDILVADNYGGEHWLTVPLDYDRYFDVIKQLGKEKNWFDYFQLKESIPDLRFREACTVHKSQGSTYDYVIIDLEDISKVRQNNDAARMLYVAVTRAKHRIILFGELTQKYGGVID